MLSRKLCSVLLLTAILAGCGGEDRNEPTPTPGGRDRQGETATAVDKVANSATTPFNDDGQCMKDDVDDYKGGPLNCTANDVSIATATVAGSSVIQCTPGQNVVVDIDALLQTSSEEERADIGIWVATDGGGDALSGACKHYNLPTSPLLANTVNGDAPTDQCAGMANKTSATVPLGQLTLPCNPIPMPTVASGEVQVFPAGTPVLQVGACISWKIPGEADAVCPASSYVDPAGNPNDPPVNISGPLGFRVGTLPATPSKCNCDPFYLEVQLVSDLTIIKNAVPDHPQDFAYTATGTGMSNFSLDDDGETTILSNTKVFEDLVNNNTARTVTEGAVTGWTTTNIACTGATQSTILIGADSDFDAGDNSVSVTLKNGENITCTFTNTASASLDIEKQSVGGTGTFGFTGTGTAPAGFSSFSRNTASANPTTTAPFEFSGANVAGTKYVQETTLPAGYVISNISCTANGATVEIGSGGSAGIDFDPDYDAGDNTVKVTLAPGSSPTCTFENTLAASIDIEKVSVGGVGLFEFTTGGSGLSDFPRTTATSGVSTATSPINLGQNFGDKYITETVPAGYTLTNIVCDAGGAVISIGTGTGAGFSGDADFDAGDVTVKAVITAGDSPSCTFTNTKNAWIDIEKVSVGGTGQFDFTTGGTGLSGFSRTTATSGVATTTDSINLGQNFGTKYITETVPAGYALTNIVCTANGAVISIGTGTGGTFSGDADFDSGDVTVQAVIDAGDSPTCTFTNTKLASLQVVKDVQNPATDPEDFAFTTTGAGLSNFDLDDDADGTLSNSTTFSNLMPGTARTITEGAEANFTLTSVACPGSSVNTPNLAGRSISVTPQPGETIVCTFINKRNARLIVEKQTIPDGATQSFTFTRTGIANFALTDGQQNNSGFTLAPGNYTVCELDLAVTWSATATLDGGAVTLVNPDSPSDNGNRCYTVALAYGDSKTIVFTNTQPPPPGGDARTIGYWRNWSSCSKSNGKQYEKAVANNQLNKTLDGNLPQTIGDLLVDTCEEGVNILSKRDLNGKIQASDPAYNLAAQLLAAKLNYTAGATQCAAATTAINSAQALLANDPVNFIGVGSYKNKIDGALANSLASTLDSYNNNTLCP